MQPRFRTSVLLLSAVTWAMAGCTEPKGVQIDLVDLVPSAASAAFGLSIGALQGSPIGTALAPLVGADSDMTALSTALKNCPVDLTQLRVVAAGNPSDESLVMMITAPGVGKRDTVRCLENESNKATGEPTSFIFFSSRGDVSVSDMEGGGKLILVNKNALVIAEPRWEAAIFDAIEHPDKRDKSKPLLAALERIDPKADLWVSAAFVPSDVSDLAELPGATALRTLNIAARLGAEVNLTVDLGFEQDSSAQLFESGIPGLLEGLKAEYPDGGPAIALLDKMQLSRAGNQVRATTNVAADQVPPVMTMLLAAAAE